MTWDMSCSLAVECLPQSSQLKVQFPEWCYQGGTVGIQEKPHSKASGLSIYTLEGNCGTLASSCMSLASWLQKSCLLFHLLQPWCHASPQVHSLRWVHLKWVPPKLWAKISPFFFMNSLSRVFSYSNGKLASMARVLGYLSFLGLLFPPVREWG